MSCLGDETQTSRWLGWVARGDRRVSPEVSSYEKTLRPTTVVSDVV